MATETKKITLDGHTYEVAQLPARLALRMVARLGRVIGPAITAALEGVKGGDLAAADLTKMGGAVSVLFERLTPDELDDLAAVFLAPEWCLVESVRDGKRVKAPLWPMIDAHFQGRVASFLRLLVFAVEVNYGDFFGVVRGLSAAPAASST